MISRVVIATAEIQAEPVLQIFCCDVAEVHPIATVPEARVSAPGHTIGGLVQVTGSIGFVEQE